MIRKFSNMLIVKLILGVSIGLIVGFYASERVIEVIQTGKFILGQIIFFSIPLIILGFIAPAIAKMKSNASKMLGVMLMLAYASSVGAALFSMFAGYAIIPMLDIVSSVEGLKKVPPMVFTLTIPPIMSVMSALILSLFLGISISWTKSLRFEELLDEFNNIVLSIVNRIIIPTLPFFIACTFAVLAYEGSITKQLPVFLTVVFIVLLGHVIWLTLLYTIAGVVSGKNPLKLLKYYGPVYLTAVGTMSSAATLPVALESVHKSKAVHKDIVNFAIPLGATIHLCGSVLTEVFFVMTVSQVLYGVLPAFGTMLLFIVLLGIFAIGAPGVPGGTVMASLGIITTILGFDDTGIALMLTIFALQDSFGTACNLVGDGALSIILESVFKKDLSSEVGIV
ncbi:MAG: dicarboxylate/amino acid:cation symporter [Desulfovibrionaceae bacterium]